jgi:hypothetical protein
MLFIFKQIYSFNIFQPVSEKQRYSKTNCPFLLDIPEQADPPSNERRISIISPDIPADADPLM